MGIMEDISATLNRGASVTAKTANIIKLKAQIADVNSQRRNLCAGLGDALYDRTKDIGAITTGLEDFYNGIANCDDRIASLQAEIEQVEASGPTSASSRANWVRTCPNCGYSMSSRDVYCSRCGMPLSGNQGWSQQPNDAPAPQQPDGNTNSARQEPVADNAPIDVEPC